MARRRLIGFGLLAILIFGPGFLQWGRLSWRSHRLQRQIAAQRVENARLQEEARRLESDPLYIEQVARRRLGVARAGELIVEVEETE